MIQVQNHSASYDAVMSDMGNLEVDRCGVDSAGINDRLALLVYRAGVEVLARGEAALAALGIDGRDYTTLAVLATDQPDSQQELARLMGKAPPIIVAAVDDVEEKGLVARRRDERDRRPHEKNGPAPPPPSRPRPRAPGRRDDRCRPRDARPRRRDRGRPHRG